MKVGKFILGFDALKVIIDAAHDKPQASSLLANLCMEAIKTREAVTQTRCGFSQRARYVENIVFENTEQISGSEEMSGWVLEIRVGPDPIVEDLSQYTVVSFFAQLNSNNYLEKVYRIDNPPELGEATP